MTERFPKLQLEDDLGKKAESPSSTEQASGPQASKKKLPPPLPARRPAEPVARSAPAAEPPKTAKQPLPATRPAPVADGASKPPLPPRPPLAPAERSQPPRAVEAKAVTPNLTAPKQGGAEAAQRPSPGAYHLSTAPQPIQKHQESKRPALAAPPPPAAAQPAPKPASAKPSADTVPAMPATKTPAAPAAVPPVSAPAPAPPAPAAAPPETAWFSSLLDAEWTDENPSPPAPADVPSSAIETKQHAVSAVTSVASPVSKPEASRAEPLDSSLCAFWLAKRCFALDVALVGEVVSVESVVSVPLAPSAFVGLFNLRGTPMALVDLAQVLELEDRAPEPVAESRGGLFALVFRSSRLTAAAVIDKMEAVLPAGRETFTRPEGADNPMVRGFVEVRHRPGLVVTVLDPTRVLERLERLKYA